MLIEQLHRRALKLRQVYIWGEFDDDLSYQALQEIEYLVGISSEPIYLVINSPGGALDAELTVVDEILAVQKVGVEVWTIATGVAHSAAATVLALGTKGCRMVRPHSSVMLHPCSISLSRDYEGNQRALMDFINRQSIAVNKMVAKACGMGRKYKKFLNDIDKGLWLDAQQAIDYGVADGIWTGPLPFGGHYDSEACNR